MIRVFSSRYLHEANYIRDGLQQQGIDAIIKNEDLRIATGELPPLDVMPEVWILNPEDVDAATSLIKALSDEAQPVNATPWSCPSCNEAHAGIFDTCWQCGSDRPPSP